MKATGKDQTLPFQIIARYCRPHLLRLTLFKEHYGVFDIVS